MHSYVHSASSHTGSVQITICFGCEISEFRFQPITDDRDFSDRLLVLASKFSNNSN